jgi:HPr kinase/phosphorylase
MDDKELCEIDRLQGSRQSTTILEIEIPRIILPVAPGRNLAVLLEGAVRSHILHIKGYDAAQDFIALQQRLISEGD